MINPQDICSAHWKFEANGLAEIGDDMAIVGSPTFPVGKWGTGYYTDNTANYMWVNGENFFTPNEFIIDVWIKTDFNVTNGASSIAGSHGIFLNYYDANNYIGCEISSNPVWGTYLFVRRGGVNTFFFNINAGMTWNAGEWQHLLICFNRTGIKIDGIGADRCRFYLNGIEVYNGAAIISNIALTNGDFYAGVGRNGIVSRAVKSILDNMKVYSTCSEESINAIIAIRHREDWTPAVKSDLPYDYCIGYWKLENEKAEIGPDLTERGTVTFEPGKFGNGMFTDNNANSLEIVNSLRAVFNPNEFIWENWIRPEGWSVTDGVVSTGDHVVFDCSMTSSDYVRFFLRDGGVGVVFDVDVAGANVQYQATTGFTIADGELAHLVVVHNRTGIGGSNDTVRIYLNKVLVYSSTTVADFQDFPNVSDTTWNLGVQGEGVRTFTFAGLIDNSKMYNGTTQPLIDAILYNRNNEDWLPQVHSAEFTKTNPRVLILNSEVDIYALGYIEKLIKVKELKTFQRDKVITNQITLPVDNFDNYFCVDNANSGFNNTNWRYQPIKIYDEDGNLIWNGIIDDIVDDRNTKKANIISKNALLKFYETKIEYESSDWETPADAWKNICDTYGISYNKIYVNEAVGTYTLEGCYIKCNFNPSDDISLQNALEKIAKFGAADCYSANNELNFKLWKPFTGGVKFSLTESDLKRDVKNKLSRVYYNNYIITYFGSGDTPTEDSDNNDIGSVSRTNNETHDIILDGGDTQQIMIKDLTSAIFLGEQHIKRSHVNLETKPLPPIIITFSLDYTYKDYLTLQTYFRLTHTDKGWTNKLFEIYGVERDRSKRIINIEAYEAQE